MYRQFPTPSGFSVTSDHNVYAVYRDDVPEACRRFLLRPWPRDLMRAPDAPVGRIPLEIFEKGDEQYLKRWYVHGGLFGPLFGGLFLGTGRPFRELHAAVYAVASGLATVEPLGICIWRVRGPIYRTALMTRRAYGATNVPEHISRRGHLDPASRRRLIERMAVAVRHMHDAGLFHADLNLMNILVRQRQGSSTDDPEILIIDWDQAMLRSRIGVLRRVRNLLRLSRSADKFARAGIPIALSDKLRFLRVYCAGQMPWVLRLALRSPVKTAYLLKWRLADVLYRSGLTGNGRRQ